MRDPRTPVRLTPRGRTVVATAVATAIAVPVLAAVAVLGGAASDVSAAGLQPSAAATLALPVLVPTESDGPAAAERRSLVLRADRSGRATGLVVEPIAAEDAPQGSDAGLDDGFVQDLAVRLPVDSVRTTATYGETGAHWSVAHTGLDFDGVTGDVVRSVTNGRITQAYYHRAYGNLVVVQRSDGVELWYAHLSSVARTSGPVKAGQPIGRMGTTGNSTGSHLHLEVRVDGVPTDPETFLWGAWPGVPDTAPDWACRAYGC
ncbi:MAG: M23 family metallopeptidase [Candidatus Nanopelagicales bacterium]